VDVIILEDIHFLKILGVWLKEIQLPDQGYEIQAHLIPLSFDGMRWSSWFQIFPLRSWKIVDTGANHTYSTTTNFYFYF
jgi:hypothetical protein